MSASIRSRLLIALAVASAVAACRGEQETLDPTPDPARARATVSERAPAPAAPPSPRPGEAPRPPQQDIADVVEKVVPSVVSVSSVRQAATTNGAPLDNPLLRRFFGFGPRGPGPEGPPGQGPEERGLGSGVVVGKDLVLTNAHVVQKADRIRVVTADGQELDAKVAGADPQSDIAVLRISGENPGLVPATFGDSSKMRLGETVLAVGNPFGVGQTVTMGIVSAKGRADVGIADYEDFIQTDAAINPGNSGGALVNLNGQVIGINTAILSRTGGYMGIGFAVPSNMVEPIMKSLLAHGRVIRGWLGVSIQPIDRELAKAFELDSSTGALVSDVEPRSPADKAGIERGDIVLSINGDKITSTGQLRNVVAAAGPDKSVQLELLRDGKRKSISAKLTEMPRSDERMGAPAEDRGTEREAIGGGLLVEDLTAETRERFGVPQDKPGGVLVVGIKPGGAAAEAGLLPGDAILELDRKPVKSVEDFKRRWSAGSGDALLWVVRQGRTLYLVAHR